MQRCSKVQEGHRPSDVLGRNYMFFHDVSLRFEKKMSDLNALELGSRLCVSRQGGMGSVIDALAAAVRREGGEIRTNVRVEEAPLLRSFLVELPLRTCFTSDSG